MASSTRQPAPWHLWMVAIVALILGWLAAFDFFMSVTANPTYMETLSLSAEHQAALTSFPSWANASWALGVIGALGGAILLLMRSAKASYAYLLSAAGSTAANVYFYTFTPGVDWTTMMGPIIAVGTVCLTLVLVIYARSLTRSSVLI